MVSCAWHCVKGPFNGASSLRPPRQGPASPSRWPQITVEGARLSSEPRGLDQCLWGPTHPTLVRVHLNPPRGQRVLTVAATWASKGV